MGLNYRQRVNLGNGVGLNVSKSGISTSYRTKFGSVSPKGFSIRTGIPGLSFRSGGKNAGLILLITMLILAAFAAGYYILLGFVWIIKESYKAIMRWKYKRELRKLGCSEIEIKNLEAGNSGI